jgi:hypothetical protein
MDIPVMLNLDDMFPGLEHQRIHYVFHVCGLRDIPSQTRLIEIEGIESVEDLANYTDSELENMRLQRTKTLKAITHWVRKRIREEAECDLCLLNQNLIAELIMEINAAAGKKDADSKLYYPDAFSATNYKNWIKKVENYLDSRTGKAGVPLSYVIRPVKADPDDAPDEYTRQKWAVKLLTGTLALNSL